MIKRYVGHKCFCLKHDVEYSYNAQARKTLFSQIEVRTFEEQFILVDRRLLNHKRRLGDLVYHFQRCPKLNLTSHASTGHRQQESTFQNLLFKHILCSDRFRSFSDRFGSYLNRFGSFFNRFRTAPFL